MRFLVQYSLNSSLSISSLAIHLSILGNFVVITSKLYFFIMFNDMFFKESNWTFVGCFIHRVLPIFLVIIWCKVCKFVWIYGIDVFFFGKFVCCFIAFNVSVCSYFI